MSNKNFHSETTTESTKKHSSKAQNFVENTKKAVRNVLISTGIMTQSLGPVATTSQIPASINTITAVSPALSTATKAITLGTATALLNSCIEKNDDFDDNDESIISGLETLKGTTMHVNQEIDLLKGITFAKGVELINTQIQIDGEIYEINNPHYYIPQYPGTCKIIFTLKTKNGNTTEISVDNLIISPLEYKKIQIKNIEPAEILPIVGQIESGDKKAYEHIEHLRIAEATKIRDLMRTYGAGNHTAEEYQQLMSRLNTGMINENPKGYDNYQTIGGEIFEQPSQHAHDERDILNSLINHANFKVVNPNTGAREAIHNYLNEYPNNINIFGCSAYADVDKKHYQGRDINKYKEIERSQNFLLFVAGSNIDRLNGMIRNLIYQEDIDGNSQGIYALPSMANGKNDTIIDRHLIVTIGTNANGDIDQTNEEYSSSKFPVGFHNDILFAGREFPHYDTSSGTIAAKAGKYPTSYVNYTNVAIADLCFQMFAEVEDVDQLLDMIRSSTDLRDHIRFDGVDQPLILMNPAGFFKKYLMPTDTISNIHSGEAIQLNKGYYKGIIFNIPGAEVSINGEWIPYDDNNKSLIKNQNPMTLEWRLNGDLCRKLGYKGKTIEGKIIVVDDKWNGLNIDKDISINMQ